MVNWQQQTEIWKRFSKPIEFVAWFAILGTLLVTLTLQVPILQRVVMGGIFILTSAYILLFFHWVIPFYGVRPWINYLVAANNGFAI